jgi:hypothetical protein
MILTSALAANAGETAPVPDGAPQAPRREGPINALDAPHRHLGGFVRPDLGFGYLQASGSQNGVDGTISGPAATLGIAVGGALSENVILAFHVWDMVVTNPTITVGGTTLKNADATVSLIAFGPEYTVYTKDNVYFAVTPSLTRGRVSTSGGSSDTNWGFGMRGAVGKEWWVGDHWGLGVAGHISFSINQAADASGLTWTGWGATIAFSATYN